MNKIITLFSLFSFLIIQQGFGQGAEPSDVLNGPYASMEFEQIEFNFGTITQGEKVKNVFVFTNTSDQPLIISSAKGSCGCTVPEWPKEPIMPGESSQLLVVFDSKGKKGNQYKKVAITANTEKAQTYLHLKGSVDFEKKSKNTQLKNRAINPDFLKIYPNPASENINISLTDYLGENATVEIFDGSGQMITSKRIDKIVAEPYNIDLSSYSSGIYTATIIVGEKMRLAKQFVVR